MRIATPLLAACLILLATAVAAEPARLIVEARDPSGGRLAVPVLVDGREAGETWRPLPIEAGRHRLEASSGPLHWASDLMVLAGARKTLSVTLHTRPEMVAVEPGAFFMGSPAAEPGRQADETRHRVELTRGFLLGVTEVSQALYEEIMGANPSRRIAPERPVENVSWFDCVRFCNRLSERHGLEPAYVIVEESVDWSPGADGYRLPTEAEWEYACRAGSDAAFGFGDDPAALHLHGNYCDATTDRAWRDPDHADGFAFTSPIGSFAPNAWGLRDMHGNVWEWCGDWWAPHGAGPLVDPTGPADGVHKVEKGGCWETGPDWCRCAYRHYVEPDQKRSYLGFRVARTASAGQ